MNRQEWLAKMEREGRADETIIIIYGKHFTPRELVEKELLWMQVVKSI